ncbi:two-component sensor histidine kinase [Pseudocitrobacter faecalis]|uniref:ATP-binding protein n=1 Tax=Pseudocitrobacter faecalis TaxID=1398493 RepID=UPI001675CB06|nr:ATP-binding protein [Pseudocitrobacter faecalis]GHD89688.1 two-component sensor histidine kinase [Pseudocitrobacter faecalis]
MRLWPKTLLYRLVLLVLAGLLLANGLTLSLLLYERMSSARTVMLDNLGYDVATSVAILDRLPANERAAWLARLARGNYHYQTDAGVTGPVPDSWRSRPIVASLQEALGTQYALKMSTIPGPREHIQAHLRLSDGSPLTIDLRPQLPALARWLPVVLVIQPLLLLLCAWLAVRQVVRPLARFTDAVETLEPAATQPRIMNDQGPLEVAQAARAFNAMQARIQRYLKERTQILAAISHDLQTPITRMKLRVEMSEEPMLRDKLMQDLESMTRLVREGIAYARSAEPLLEPTHRLDLNAFLDTLVCDYTDTGQAVTFLPAPTILPMETRPQALRRIMTNLLDNALKYGCEAQVHLLLHDAQWLEIQVRDNGPGIDEAEQDAVLQPFYRIENSRNRHTGGTGLGLAIAAQLAAQLHGQLRLHNHPEGGLVVTLRLPRALYPSVSPSSHDN